MKHKLIRILALLCLLLAKPFAVDAFTASEYETLTLRLYYEQKWDSLINIGEQAIHEGHDYFYMRFRVGRAAFEKKRYSRAARHLEKARLFNSRDEYTNLLLYKAYQFSNRSREASLLLKKIPEAQRVKYRKAERLPLLYMETGPGFSDHIRQYEKGRQTEPGLYSEAYLNRNSQYLLAGLTQNAGYRVQVNAAAALLNFNKERIVNIAGIDSLSGNYAVSEWEAYLSPSVQISRQLNISPAFRLIHVGLENPLSSNDSLVQRLIGPSVKSTYYDYAAGGEISCITPYLSFSAGSWLIHIDKNDFTQISGNVFLMPYGNLNLYLSTTYTRKYSSGTNASIISQMIGGRLTQKIWAEAAYTIGDLSQTAELNLQLIFNSFDKVNNRSSIRLIYCLNDYLKFELLYQYFAKAGTELFYSLEGNPSITNYTYHSQNITGGIVWKLH